MYAQMPDAPLGEIVHRFLRHVVTVAASDPSTSRAPSLGPLSLPESLAGGVSSRRIRPFSSGCVRSPEAVQVRALHIVGQELQTLTLMTLPTDL